MLPQRLNALGMLLLVSCTVCFSQSVSELSVDYIMRDSKWLGAFPQNPFWSEDGKVLYFNWNPEDSLYAAGRNGDAPRQRHA